MTDTYKVSARPANKAVLGPDHHRHVLFNSDNPLDERIRAAHRLAVEEFLEVCRDSEPKVLHKYCVAWTKHCKSYRKLGQVTFVPGCWWTRKNSNQKATIERFGVLQGHIGHRLMQEYADWMDRFIGGWMTCWNAAHNIGQSG